MNTTRQTLPMSKEAIINLFNDCLTRAEQITIAHKLNCSLDELFIKSDTRDLYTHLMVYLRG